MTGVASAWISDELKKQLIFKTVKRYGGKKG
jgi:hypothetical protein